MAKIKIRDIARDAKVSKDEMKEVMGGVIGDAGRLLSYVPIGSRLMSKQEGPTVPPEAGRPPANW